MELVPIEQAFVMLKLERLKAKVFLTLCQTSQFLKEGRI